MTHSTSEKIPAEDTKQADELQARGPDKKENERTKLSPPDETVFRAPESNFEITLQQKAGLSLRTRITLAIAITSILAMLAIGSFSFLRNNVTQTFLGGQFQLSVKEKSDQQIINLVDRKALTINEFFVNINRNAEATAAYMTNLWKQQNTFSDKSYWDAAQKLSRAASGLLDNPNSDFAAVVTPPIDPLTEEWISDLNSSMHLDFVAPEVLKANPTIVAVYYIDKANFTIYYPNIDLANLLPGNWDATQQGFFTIVSSQKDSERRSAWTPPYQDPALTGLIVTNSAPVYDRFGKFRGVIGMDVQLAQISEEVKAITIGKTGYAFLIDPAGRIIAMPDSGYTDLNIIPEEVPVNESPQQSLLKEGPQDIRIFVQAMTRGDNGLGTVDIQGVERYLAYGPIAETGYSLAIVVPSSEMNTAFTEAQNKVARETQSTITYGIAIFMATLVIAVVVSFATSRLLTKSLQLLTETVQKVGAGDLTARATVQSSDEVGILAGAFNSMTVRLSDLFSSLEQRIAARTKDLATVAEISRHLSINVDQKQLLNAVVDEVRNAFNYYCVQVYLYDETSEELLISGGTGEIGQALLARGNRIAKGNGLIGRAAEINTFVLVSDTAKDPDYLYDPLLPETKSEVAVPISIGDQVLGVLDVQQASVNGLDQKDADLLQSLTGQIAIALRNTRAFGQSKAQAELETLVNAIGQKIQRATSVDDTLQIAIREIGLALGASRVSAKIGTSRQDDGDAASRN